MEQLLCAHMQLCEVSRAGASGLRLTKHLCVWGNGMMWLLRYTAFGRDRPDSMPARKRLKREPLGPDCMPAPLGHELLQPEQLLCGCRHMYMD